MTDTIENVDPGVGEDQHVLRQVGMMMEPVSGPPWLAIAGQITSDHISTVLGQVGRSQENDQEKTNQHSESVSRMSILGHVFSHF